MANDGRRVLAYMQVSLFVIFQVTYCQVEDAGGRLVAAALNLCNFPFSLRPRWLCGSRHHHASCPALSNAPFPASRGVHCPGSDSHPAPDEGTRPWDRRSRSPAYHHDYCSNNGWSKLWASDHPKRYLAARPSTIMAGGSRTSRRSGMFTVDD